VVLNAENADIRRTDRQNAFDAPEEMPRLWRWLLFSDDGDFRRSDRLKSARIT
jgi:hypothetical protein